jgi:hypothetical protein
MGSKNTRELLSGATATGAGTPHNIGQYQKAMMVEVKTTAGTPAFTIQLQYKDELGNWEAWHEEVVSVSTDDPLNVQLESYPWHDIRAEITAYTSGTVSAYAYLI